MSRMFKLSLAASMAVVSAMAFGSAGAQNARKAVTPLSLDDAFSSNEFLLGSPYLFSPDGTQLAYVLCDEKRRAAYPREKVSTSIATYGGAALYTLGCDIWVSPAGGGTQRNITNAIGNNWGPAWSPDGKQIAFYSDREDSPRLWIWDSATGQSRAVSDEKIRTLSGHQLPVWTPDGKHIVARMRPLGKTSEELAEELPPAADGKPAAPAKAGSTVRVLESGQPKKADGKPATGRAEPPKRMMADIGIVDVATGQVRRIVKETYTSSMWLSPDGKRLLYPVWKGPRVGSAVVSPIDFAVVDVQTGQSRVVATDVLQYEARAASWSPNSKSIAYLVTSPDAKPDESLETGFGSDAWGDLHVVSADGGTPQKLQPTESVRGFDADNSLQPWWSADSRSIYVIGESRLWRGTPSEGRVVPLTPKGDIKVADIVGTSGGSRAWTPKGSEVGVFTRNDATQQHAIYLVQSKGGFGKGFPEDKRYAWRDESPIASADGSRVAYAAQSIAQRMEIWTTTPQLRAPTRITKANPQLERYTFGQSKLIEYRSTEGQPLKASLLLPAGYEPGKRYPTIVLVYASGNGSKDVNAFGLWAIGQYNFQLQATRGYAVVYPDIPVKVGSPLPDMMKSVGPAMDRLIELGIADGERFGLTGQSNGGYSTLSIITQTNRFKAAVMNAGFGDLTGFYGAMGPDGSGVWHPWLEKKGGAMGVAPWEDPKRYVENSPIYYLDRITTPLIIQAGSEDAAIVPFSDQVFVGLKRLNKEVTYLRYGGEGHLLQIHDNQIDYWNRVLPFWDKHLKKE